MFLQVTYTMFKKIAFISFFVSLKLNSQNVRKFQPHFNFKFKNIFCKQYLYVNSFDSIIKSYNLALPKRSSTTNSVYRLSLLKIKINNEKIVCLVVQYFHRLIKLRPYCVSQIISYVNVHECVNFYRITIKLIKAHCLRGC